MSYPKRPLSISGDAKKEGYGDIGQKRVQLKTLLVNKFRGKYGQLGSDRIDEIINREVDQFVTNTKMTEANLLRLD